MEPINIEFEYGAYSSGNDNVGTIIYCGKREFTKRGWWKKSVENCSVNIVDGVLYFEGYEIVYEHNRDKEPAMPEDKDRYREESFYMKEANVAVNWFRKFLGIKKKKPTLWLDDYRTLKKSRKISIKTKDWKIITEANDE